MVRHYPPTPRQLVAAASVFLTGVVLIAVGANLSYENIAPSGIKYRKVFGDMQQLVELYFCN